MKDIYKQVVKDDRLHETYKLLTTSALFQPARTIVENIAATMSDKDGNYVQQFQSDGFDARLWEMYLHIFLTENKFELLNDVDRPDFHVKKKGLDLFIEASLSAEKNDDIFTKDFITEALAKGDLAVQQKLIDYYIMRMGSVLYSKLNKRYWELDWVKGKPLILAITPAHNYIANFLPDAKIIEYLYGIRKVINVTEKGIENVEDIVVTEHRFNDKVIPSNFFAQHDTENISAILFTNNSDIHKFNRMAIQSGLNEKKLVSVRSGFMYDAVEGAKAKEFTYPISSNSKENWCESVSIFHNPNAKVKVDKSVFEHIRQMWIESDQSFNGIMTNDFVYHSITGTMEIV
jgi:hypothetical protein